MKNILLTGRPRCGKTTLIKNIINKLPNIKKLGFFTEEIRENNVRVGFKIITLDGQEGVLSHVKFKSQYKVGKYRVDIDALEDIAANSLIMARKEADLIAIDEIGKMELFSELMRLSIIEALDCTKKVIATIGDMEDEFTDKIKKREDVEIIKVTAENRDGLAEEISNKLLAPGS